jgi:hypothetical protein
MRRPRPPRGCRAIGKKIVTEVIISQTFLFTSINSLTLYFVKYLSYPKMFGIKIAKCIV